MPWDDSDDERPRRGRGQRRGEDEPPEQDGDSNMKCEVVMAAYYGDVDMIGATLRKGGDVDELDPKEQWRPLHAAAFTESTDAVAYLLRMRADANAPGPHGQSALHMAARDNSDEVVALLLKGGADPGLVDANGRTPGQLAQERGSCRTLALLPEGSSEEAVSAAASAREAQAPAPQPSDDGSSAAPAARNRSCFGPSVVPMAGVGMLHSQAAQSAAPAAQPAAAAEASSAAKPVGARAAGRTEFGSAVDPDLEENVDDGVEDVHKGWAVG